MYRLTGFIFTLYCSLAVMVSFIPLYFQNAGLSSTEIGTILGLGSFVSVFAQPFWGIVSDRKRTVKKVLIFLMFATLLSSIALYSVHALIPLLAIACVFFFFHNAMPALTDSMAVTTAEETGRSYGGFRMWGDFGVGTSSLVLGLLLGIVGIQYLWFFYAGIMFIAIGLAFTLKDASIKAKPITRQAVASLFTNKPFLWLMFIVFFLSLPHRMNDGLLGIYMTSVGGTTSQVGQAWMVATFSSLPAFALTGYLLRHNREYLILAATGFIYAARWVFVSHVSDPTVLIYLSAIQGLCFPVFFVTTIHLMHRIVPPEVRNTGQTTFAAVFGGLASIVGSAGGGWVMDYVAPAFAYVLSTYISLFGGLCALATYFYVRRRGLIPLNKEQSEA